jgi:hypothetical protein
MINLGKEDDYRGTEWIILRELNLYFEYASGIWTVRRTKDNAFPEEEIIAFWASATVMRRIALDVLEFLLNATKGHL